MPPGQGKRDLHVSIDAEAKAYLEAEARYRRIPVSTLLLDACEIILHPERTERGALSDQLLSVAATLAKLQPQWQALERAASRSEALGRELDSLRADVRASLASVQTELTRFGEVRRSQQIRRYALGGLTIAFGLAWIWLYWPAFSLGSMVALLGVAIVLIP